MKRILPLLLLLAVFVGGLAYQIFLKPTPQGSALRARQIATRGLADYLAAHHAGQRALVVSNPFTQRKDPDPAIVATEEAGLRGLREGLAGKVASVVAWPELKPEALSDPRALIAGRETVTPLSYCVATDAFDKLARAHPECGLVISLVGLPAELDSCEIWKQSGAPRFALLLPDLGIVGDVNAVVGAFQSGKLLACVLRKPGGRADETPARGDFKTEFEQRFLLLTAENAGPLFEASPGLLGSPQVPAE